MNNLKTFIRYFAIAFTLTFVAFLLAGCAVTRIDLPGGVSYYSGRDIIISNLVADVTSSNGTAHVVIGSVSASASQPTDANTRQIQAVGALLETAAATAAKKTVTP